MDYTIGYGTIENPALTESSWPGRDSVKLAKATPAASARHGIATQQGGKKMCRQLQCLSLLVLLGFSPAGFGWGQDGHRLICALADTQLTPQGREFVDSVSELGSYLDNKTPSLAEACVWPDSAKYSGYRGSYETHFINIPATADTIDLTRDCAALDCIAAGIQRSLVYLASYAGSSREKARKAAALRFLGHLIGDLHQPLHVSHGEDWGGNSIKVRWFDKETNLHRVWDTDILVRANITYPQGLELLESVPADAGDTDIAGWMHETFSLARQKAYKGPAGRRIVSGDVLDQRYFNHAKPVVIDQLVKAGARLGSLLNRLAAGEIEPVFIRLFPLEASPAAPRPAGSGERSGRTTGPPP